MVAATKGNHSWAVVYTYHNGDILLGWIHGDEVDVVYNTSHDVVNNTVLSHPKVVVRETFSEEISTGQIKGIVVAGMTSTVVDGLANKLPGTWYKIIMHGNEYWRALYSDDLELLEKIAETVRTIVP